MLTFSGYLSVIFSLIIFLPLFFWWQIPFYLIAAFSGQLIALIIVFTSKVRLKLFLFVILVISTTYFYYSNWVSIKRHNSSVADISVGLDYQVADIVFSYRDFKFYSSANSLLPISDPIYSLNQTSGKVALGRFKDLRGRIFSVAILSTDNLLTSSGWSANRILMRRLTSILRQREEPVIVILNSNLPAGSDLLKLFMFQARLDSLASLDPIRTLFGFNGTMLLGREVNFSKSNDSSIFYVDFQEHKELSN